jgi:hypothetical protein
LFCKIRQGYASRLFLEYQGSIGIRERNRDGIDVDGAMLAEKVCEQAIQEQTGPVGSSADLLVPEGMILMEILVQPHDLGHANRASCEQPVSRT